jgi:hypothetical protein
MRNLVRFTLVFGLCAVLLALSQGMVFAQGGGGGGGGGGRNFDPAARQAQRVDGVIQDLELKDEEATVIKPLVTEVVKCQMSQMMGRMGGGRGGRGGGAAAGGGGGRAQAPEIEALRAAVEKADTPAAELKTKMAAVRDARKKADEALQKAREALRKALTTRQEAQLLLSGMLD